MLLHGQTDSKDEDDKRFFAEAVHRSINDALKNHNTFFLNTFWNIVKEVFHGASLKRYGPPYFKILDSSSQEMPLPNSSQ